MKNIQKIDITKFKAFENHPYKVKDDEEMEALADSIKEHGVLTPIIVRPLKNEEYEIISGHRRLFASKRAGLTEVPALVVEMDRDNAIHSIRKKAFRVTTNSNHNYAVSPNLLKRDFKSDKPNQKWVGDITYIPTDEGWLYAAIRCCIW